MTGLGIRMLTLVTKTSLFTEDRGFQIPMVLEKDLFMSVGVMKDENLKLKDPHSFLFILTEKVRVKERK